MRMCSVNTNESNTSTFGRFSFHGISPANSLTRCALVYERGKKIKTFKTDINTLLFAYVYLNISIKKKIAIIFLDLKTCNFIVITESPLHLSVLVMKKKKTLSKQYNICLFSP